MPISAKRFEFLSDETNVAVSDFQTSNNTGTLNVLDLSIDSVSNDVKDFLSNLDVSNLDAKKINELVAANPNIIKDTINSKIREVRGIGTQIEDLALKTPKEISAKLKSLANDNVLVAALIDKLPTICKSDVLAKSPSNNNFPDKGICNGRSRDIGKGCSSGSKDFGAGISELTGGTFNYNFESLSSLYNMLTGLSIGGFSMDMCGVFNSLVSSFGITDTSLLSKASGVVINELLDKKDTLGLLDMASSSINLPVNKIIPEIRDSFLNVVKLPDNTKATELSSIYDQVDGALTVYDGAWSTVSNTFDLKLHTGKNDDLKSMLTSKTLDIGFNSASLGVAPSHNEAFLLTALV